MVNNNTENEILYWIVLVLSLVLVLFVIPRLYFYTAEGHITNFYQKECHKGKKPSNRELLEDLYKLSIYDYCKVRWHYTFLLSLVSAIFVLYLINGCLNLRNLIILTLIFFVVIEVPSRLENGHIKGKIANKSTMIYSKLRERLNLG